MTDCGACGDTGTVNHGSDYESECSCCAELTCSNPVELRAFAPLACIHRANCPTCHELVTRFTRAVRLLVPMVSTTTLREADDLQAVEDLLLPVFGARTWEQIFDD